MKIRAIAVAAAFVLSTPLAADPVSPASAATAIGIDPAGLPVEVGDVEGVERALFRDGRVFIGGQPSEAALRKLKELGVTAIVNLRGEAEMANREAVPFDEAALAAELGLEYVHVPISGEDHPYRPEVLERLEETLRKHNGPVLLHCTVGWRASYAWTGYLVRYQGLGVDDALARGRAMQLSEDPLARLLGRPMKLVYADEAPAQPQVPALPVPAAAPPN
ncbi:MAG: hypothetical protein AMXMBFR36_21700 [Acidobacteriota bacterium]